MHKEERPVFWVFQRNSLPEIYYINLWFFIYYHMVMAIIAFESVIGFATVSPQYRR